MNAYRNYNNNTRQINRNIEKLSSGYKINRAGDDAAGLAISEKMRAQITGLEGAQKNAKDGISLVQTAEGALTEIHSMLNRMYSLAEQSANGTYDENTDRAQLQKEVSSLRTEINRIADSANFNGLKLLDGSMARASVDWASTTKDELKSYLGISLLAESKTDTDAFTKALYEADSGKFVVAIDDVPAEGKKLTFDALAELKDMGYTITATDSNGKEIEEGSGKQWNSTAGELKFGKSGEAFAYDGNHGVTFKLSKGDKDIAQISYRFDATDKEIDDGAEESELKLTNTANLKGLNLQIGDDANSWNIMNVNINDIHANALGIANVDISEQGSTQTAMNAIKDAINYVSDARGGLGATQNRLDHTINNLSVMQENIQDAESTIRDTDVANEMMKYTKNSILVQSAQAMLAQANQQPQGILQLLQ